MLFPNKAKKSVTKFFDYVENDLLPKEKEADSILSIKNKLISQSPPNAQTTQSEQQPMAIN